MRTCHRPVANYLGRHSGQPGLVPT
jgi:hypothetical protein